MKEFVKHFRRNPDGSWTCISFAEIATITGRIQVTEGSTFMPGTTFMAVNICELLDNAEIATDRGRVPTFPATPSPQNPENQPTELRDKVRQQHGSDRPEKPR